MNEKRREKSTMLDQIMTLSDTSIMRFFCSSAFVKRCTAFLPDIASETLFFVVYSRFVQSIFMECSDFNTFGNSFIFQLILFFLFLFFSLLVFVVFRLAYSRRGENNCLDC